MTDMTAVSNPHDFSGMHAAMQRYVDGDLLAGVSSAVLVGRDLVDLHCCGWSDKEAGDKLAPNHIFRAFSNTKLITSCAALLLHEAGRFQLDDPIEQYLPQLGKRRVLRPGATDGDDTEPAAASITIRHLMTHTAGFIYQFLEPDSLLGKMYAEMRVYNPNTSLSEMVDKLAGLPLSYHPGSRWVYSVAMDVVARLIEVISGQDFAAFLQERIFAPLGMVDTGFVVPAENLKRLVAFYAGADQGNPMVPGLTKLVDAPHPGAYVKPFPLCSGGGGLVTTLPDMVALVRALMPGGNMLLKPGSMALLHTNQLPEGRHIQFSGVGEIVGMGHGLASSVTLAALPQGPAQVSGELQWGGIGGTHWWIDPRKNMAGMTMSQRHMAFWHPHYFEIKRLARAAVPG